ncbi:MAG: glycosyltransferase family 39 protein [Chthoniobacteraceae bacterium]
MVLDVRRGGLIPRMALAWLILSALVLAVWPIYRIGLKASIDPNEGWNAYLADAAMGSAPLYPPPDQLITNNYPPLSFYAVGLAGKLLGDNVLAGRWLSLLAVAGIAFAVARMVLALGGNRSGALIGAVWFAGTMCRYFTDYVGMDDPQLLAQALMALAFAGFLRTAWRGGDGTAYVLAMVVAGFFKHNIIAMPAAAMAWLFLYRRGHFLKCATWAGGAVLIGFALCCGLYGEAFIFNFFLTPRSHDWHKALSSLAHLRYVVAALLAWVALGRFGGRERGICHLWAGIALAVFFVQKLGAGVDVNAEFDWLIALSVIVGLALSRLFQVFPGEGMGLALARAAAVLFIWAGWWMTPNVKISRLAFDPSFREGIAKSEREMVAAIAQARAASGNVRAEPLICYRAGKPLAVDEFNVQERIRAGKLPADTLDLLVKSRKLIEIEPPVGLP